MNWIQVQQCIWTSLPLIHICRLPLCINNYIWQQLPESSSGGVGWRISGGGIHQVCYINTRPQSHQPQCVYRLIYEHSEQSKIKFIISTLYSHTRLSLNPERCRQFSNIRQNTLTSILTFCWYSDVKDDVKAEFKEAIIATGREPACLDGLHCDALHTLLTLHLDALRTV